MRSVSPAGCATFAPRPRAATAPELVDLSFDTISGAGPNGAIIHYHGASDQPAAR